MTYGDLKKKLYCDAFLQLCETRDLSSITVTNVIEAAGTARQTFYNHFSDINELIGYIPINSLRLTDIRSISLRPSMRRTIMRSSTKGSSRSCRAIADRITFAIHSFII